MIKLNIQRFASTNKTTHYELNQYIGTDKPTYLTDYNQDMAKIDAGIYGAKAEADTNATAIGTLSNLTTTEKSNLVGAINEIDSDLGTLSTTVGNHTTAIADNTSDIGTLFNLTTSAKSNLVAAVNEVDGNCDSNTSAIGTLSSLTTSSKSNLVAAVNEVNGRIDLSSITSYTASDYKTSGGTISGSVTIARNSEGSIAKIYGNIIDSNNSNRADIVITIPNTGLTPDTELTIEPAGIALGNGFNYAYPRIPKYTIKTNGTLVITCHAMDGTNMNTDILLFPCLYFISDFGDVPSNN